MTGHPVQVWWARLGDARAGLLGLLDPVERARYESTVDPAGRGRFLVGCALSRLVLGELLGLPPADVPLRRVCPRCGGPHGKVHLEAPPNSPSGPRRASSTDGRADFHPDFHPDFPPGAHPGLSSASRSGAHPGLASGAAHPGLSSGAAHPDLSSASRSGAHPGLASGSRSGGPPACDFSVTHSGALVGVAVFRGGEVGLDVEESHGDMDVDSAARVALSDAELAALYARPADERRPAFLRTWTRKEAVLKALGVGLGVPPRGLELSEPDRPPTVLTWPGRLTPRRMVLADLVVDGVHPAAVAVAPTGAGSGTGEGGTTGGREGEASLVRVVEHDGSGVLAAYER
ncbi:4'-phosphopantetheinyl transferase superfamily protein [Streptomyces sp. NPDC005859]|uniref:4'-phosphopantetheinyl transferase family protein n=1 Tax=Streptomyces sp. NPDC005859 TaxID=3157170 RepID=UPI0033CE4B58